MKKILYIILGVVLFAGSIMGLAQGIVMNSSEFNKCTYESVLAYNPGYLLGCALAKPRFK